MSEFGIAAGDDMSKHNDDAAAKGRETHRALMPAKTHLDEPLLELKKAMVTALRNRNREQFEQALRKRGCPGPQREEFLKQFDEILRKLLAGSP
jgi:hypothetical protein